MFVIKIPLEQCAFINVSSGGEVFGSYLGVTS